MIVVPGSAVRKGSLLVDSSTINPKLATDMSKQASSCGATYIDAPVSGGKGREEGL